MIWCVDSMMSVLSLQENCSTSTLDSFSAEIRSRCHLRWNWVKKWLRRWVVQAANILPTSSNSATRPSYISGGNCLLQLCLPVMIHSTLCSRKMRLSWSWMALASKVPALALAWRVEVLRFCRRLHHWCQTSDYQLMVPGSSLQSLPYLSHSRT